MWPKDKSSSIAPRTEPAKMAAAHDRVMDVFNYIIFVCALMISQVKRFVCANLGTALVKNNFKYCQQLYKTMY